MSGQSAVPGAVILGSDFKALGVIRSLGRRGIPSVVVDDRPRAAWYSRYVVRRCRWKGAMWGPQFLSFLLTLAQEHDLERWVLFPLQDEVVELVARNAQRLAGTYRLVTQPWDTLRWAHDKRLAYQVAKEVGIDCPKTWYPASEKELDAMEITFPAIIKPAVSVRLQYAIGRKALVAENPAALLSQYRAALAVIEPEGLMVQEVIPGDGRSQYAVAAFCDEGTLLASMTARRTRQYPFDYGMSSSFVEAIEVPRLVGLAERLLRRLRLTGMVEVEFKHDRRDGRDKLLDINVRPWGWHTLCIACGLDFPFIQYRHALRQPIVLSTPRYGYRWRRLITDIPAGLQEIRHGWTTPAAYLRSLMGTSVPSVFDWRDPLPALGDIAVAVSRSLPIGRHGRSPLPTQHRPVTSSEPIRGGDG
jgi:predicted ATP-grasp superfamily ATP-dependent carboligase